MNIGHRTYDILGLSGTWDIVGHSETQWDIVGHVDIVGHSGTNWNILEHIGTDIVTYWDIWTLDISFWVLMIEEWMYQ